MNKVSTAIYLLIAVVIVLLAITMVKPIIVDKAGAETAQIKFFNFKKLA